MPMKPAFDIELALTNNGRTVSAAGPYDVQEGDTDAYLWIRISQKSSGAEAIATHEQEKDDIAGELNRVSVAIGDAIAAAVGSSLPAAGKAMTPRAREKVTAAVNAAAEAAAREIGPRWAKEVTVAEEAPKKFRSGRAMAEGWLLTKAGDDDPGRNVFWRSEVTLSAKAAAKPPAPKPPARRRSNRAAT